MPTDIERAVAITQLSHSLILTALGLPDQAQLWREDAEADRQREARLLNLEQADAEARRPFYKVT